MSEKGTSLAQYVEHFGLEILNPGDTFETDKVESTNTEIMGGVLRCFAFGDESGKITIC